MKSLVSRVGGIMKKLSDRVARVEAAADRMFGRGERAALNDANRARLIALSFDKEGLSIAREVAELMVTGEWESQPAKVAELGERLESLCSKVGVCPVGGI